MFYDFITADKKFLGVLWRAVQIRIGVFASQCMNKSAFKKLKYTKSDLILRYQRDELARIKRFFLKFKLLTRTERFVASLEIFHWISPVILRSFSAYALHQNVCMACVRRCSGPPETTVLLLQHC